MRRLLKVINSAIGRTWIIASVATGQCMNIENLLPWKRRKAWSRPAVPAEMPKDMLQLLGKSTGDEMLNSFLKNTSVAPLSIYSRLRQLGVFCQDNLWNITAREASDVLKAFGRAYELIVEEDKRTGIDTCRGYCKEYGTRCVAVGRDEFNSALQEAGNAIRRHGTAGEEGKRFEAAGAAK